MDNHPMRSWNRARKPAGGVKSHAELKRTSSIGYGKHTPSPPRGDGNVTFFGVEKPGKPDKPAKAKRKSR